MTCIWKEYHVVTRVRVYTYISAVQVMMMEFQLDHVVQFEDGLVTEVTP